MNPPRPTKKEVNPLTVDQVKSLLSVVDNERDRALYLLAVTTGMRQGEILGLRWKDLDLAEKVVRVRRTLSITREGVTFIPPKSAKGNRSVGLIPSTVEALKVYRGTVKSEYPGDGESLVFSTRSGTPLRPQNLVRRRFKPLLRRAGLPEGTRFHDLRHTCASLLLVEGVHKIVQETLGQASISLTLDTYSHILPSLQEKATLAMEEALGSPIDFDNSSDNNRNENPSVPPTGFEPVPPS